MDRFMLIAYLGSGFIFVIESALEVRRLAGAIRDFNFL